MAAFAVIPGVPDLAHGWWVGSQRIQEELASALRKLHGDPGSGSP